MYYQRGFTLIELMVTVAIIAILSGIGLPSYQRYIQKAALIDMLQASIPYKSAVELCFLEQNSLTECNAGSQGIPNTQNARYVSTVQTIQGVITLSGKQSLEGLTVTLTPTNKNGNLIWNRTCTTTDTTDTVITNSCKNVFYVNDKAL